MIGQPVQAGQAIGSSDPCAPRREGDTWTLPEPGQRCSQPQCGRPAIMVMLRIRRKPRRRWSGELQGIRWGCCDRRDHGYGRVRIGDEIYWDPRGRLAAAAGGS